MPFVPNYLHRELLVPLYDVGCLDRQVCGMLIGSHLGAGRHGRLTHYPFAINFSHRCPRKRSRVYQRRPHVGPGTRPRGSGRREGFDMERGRKGGRSPRLG